MSKPAPTPWGLLPYDRTDIHQGYSIVDANGKPIAAVKSEPYFDSLEQLEATARLMKSAPELLGMLKDAAELGETGSSPHAIARAIRREIARVEG